MHDLATFKFAAFCEYRRSQKNCGAENEYRLIPDSRPESAEQIAGEAITAADWAQWRLLLSPPTNIMVCKEDKIADLFILSSLIGFYLIIVDQPQEKNRAAKAALNVV